jgi:hypothetical protein
VGGTFKFNALKRVAYSLLIRLLGLIMQWFFGVKFCDVAKVVIIPTYSQIWLYTPDMKVKLKINDLSIYILGYKMEIIIIFLQIELFFLAS